MAAFHGWLPKGAGFPQHELLQEGLKNLLAADAPVLYFDAFLYYDASKVENDRALRTQLEQLVTSGAVSNWTLEQWLHLPLPRPLQDRLKRLQALSARGRSGTTRVACPVILNCPTKLCPPSEVLTSIRWVEVRARDPAEPVAVGFTSGWPDRLAQIKQKADELLAMEVRAGAPQWHLLRTDGHAVPSSDLSVDSSSMELAAFIAYVVWASAIRPPFAIAATGEIRMDDGSVQAVAEPGSKQQAVSREAANVGVLMLPAGRAEHALAGPFVDCSPYAVRNLRDVVSWLQRYGGDPSSTVESTQPGALKALARRLRGRRRLLTAMLILVSTGAGAVAWSLLGYSAARTSSDYPRHVALLLASGYRRAASMLRGRPGPSTGANPPRVVPHMYPGRSDIVPDEEEPCEDEEAGVCVARLESRLFNGGWPEGVTEAVRWGAVHESDDLLVGIRSLRGQPLVIASAPATGVESLVRVQGQVYQAGAFYVCLEDIEGAYRLCGGVTSNQTTVRDGGQAPGFDRESRAVASGPIAVRMGLEFSSARSFPPASSRRVDLRWATIGVRPPLMLALRRPAGDLSTVLRTLPASGEASVGLPDDYRTEQWVEVCVMDEVQRFVFCRRRTIAPFAYSPWG